MKDKNFRLVKTSKKDHICDICGIEIPAASKCISFTRVFEGERTCYINKWICESRELCTKRTIGR